MINSNKNNKKKKASENIFLYLWLHGQFSYSNPFILNIYNNNKKKKKAPKYIAYIREQSK